LRIGVHSGRVFAAQVGDIEHIELVVTGRTINRVALAQEIAATGEVVISWATRALLDGPITEDRQGGFYLLAGMPGAAGPPPERWRWEQFTAAALDGSGPGMAELVTLATRIDSLRPYLPRSMPRRFLALSDGSVELGEFRPVSVLFANFYPFSSA